MWFEYERRKRLIQEKNLPSEQYEEEINMCILEMQTDELGTLTMEKIIKKLPQYIRSITTRSTKRMGYRANSRRTNRNI